MIGVDKWHRVLGELRSMVISLHGSRVILRHLQEDLRHIIGKQVTVNMGIHQDLEYFCWLSENVGRRHTRLKKMVLIHPTLDSYHKDSRHMCVGAILP